MTLVNLRSGYSSIKLLMVLCVILLNSCQGINSKDVGSKEEIEVDTIVKEIPLNKKGKPYSYYNNKANVENKIGLTTLENGFDSLQIRVWYGYVSSDTAQLFLLKRHAGKWNAELYTLIYSMNELDDSLLSIGKEVTLKNPKSGWSLFTDRFFGLGITTLPDSKKISGYPDFADGNSVIVEVSSKFRYRIYSYKEPGKAKDAINEAGKVEDILELISNEFDFKQIRKI